MNAVEITTIGERGQVVIPQSLREELKIHKGDKFMLMHKDEMIIMKPLHPPTKAEFEKMLNKAHKHAEKHNLTEKDMWDAIERVRKR